MRHTLLIVKKEMHVFVINETIFLFSRIPSNKMSNTIDMYYFPASPPSRAALLVAKVIGVELNLKSVNIMKGEQMAPYYVKVNNIVLSP